MKKGAAPSTVDQVDEARADRAAKSYMAAQDAVLKAVGLGGEARISLARKNKESGEWEHIKSFPADHFDMDQVALEYGGGHYRVLVYGVREDGSKGWLEGMGTVFDIAGESLPIRRQSAPAVNVTEGAPAARGGPDTLMLVLLDQANRRADDLRETLLALIGAERKGGSGDGALDKTLETLSRFGVLGGDKGPGFDPQKYATDLVDMWHKGIERGEELAPGRRSSTGFADVVREVAPILKDGMDMFREAQGNTPPLKLVPGAAAKPGPVAPPTAVDLSTLPPWLQAVHKYLPLLVGMAVFGSEPEGVAVDVLNKLDEDTVAALTQDVQVEGWEQKTLGLLPPQLSQAHAGWTQRVLAAIKAEVLRPEEPEGK